MSREPRSHTGPTLLRTSGSTSTTWRGHQAVAHQCGSPRLIPGPRGLTAAREQLSPTTLTCENAEHSPLAMVCWSR